VEPTTRISKPSAERAVLQIRKPPNYRSRFAKRLKADMFASALSF
jgi:hypothetical protein